MEEEEITFSRSPDQAQIYISVMSEALHFSLEIYILQRSVAERDFHVETKNHS
jgi:hypothetical protein